MTFFLVELFRSRRPGRSALSRKAPKLRNSDADGAWKECLDRGIYGATTADYSLQGRRSVTRRPSAKEQITPNRQ